MQSISWEMKVPCECNIGVKRDSLFINDGYVDEYYMAKLLQ
ncbi:hypothetical protein [Planococcus rifietoensis]